MADNGVPVDRVINAGGIPQHNKVLNQVYANVLGKPVLVPAGTPTSVGSGIFALVAAKVFATIEEAQEKMCLPYITYEPESGAAATYEQLYPLYRKVYFALGTAAAPAAALGDVLPELRSIAAKVQGHAD
jgi:L-ribulokinase